MTIGKRALLVTVTAVLMTGSFGSASAVADQRPREVVRTESGPVRGIATESYRSFHGIPFAAPPVGDLRWRSPQRPRPWTGTRDATKPAPACAQGSGGGQTNTSEDCLYLNVATPNSATPGRSKPVMVWLHGGGNSYGTASAVDPHRLAVGGDVVVVTTNYRLGVFGNLNHPRWTVPVPTVWRINRLRCVGCGAISLGLAVTRARSHFSVSPAAHSTCAPS